MTVSNDNAALCSSDIRRRFDNAADDFDDADFVHRVTRDGLLSRIQPMAVDANVVIDLGSATGSAVRLLEKRFRGARVVAVDLSGRMLGKLQRKRSWFSKIAAVQGDARALPFADASVDVFFANMLLPWIDDPAAVFDEIARVLRPDGLFAFATLGPDSLLELRDAWRAVDEGVHVRRFADMHDIGDALVRAGLRDPVLDVDRLTVSYEDSDSLFRDITATGARNSLQQRARGLVGRRRFRAMADALFGTGTSAGAALSFELVYGHCWGGTPRSAADGVPIDAANIPLRRR
jgi:malonyl-CoA O-methyltransferase